MWRVTRNVGHVSYLKGSSGDPKSDKKKRNAFFESKLML